MLYSYVLETAYVSLFEVIRTFATWFVGSKPRMDAFVYQYLTSVRHTQKQSKTATGTPS